MVYLINLACRQFWIESAVHGIDDARRGVHAFLTVFSVGLDGHLRIHGEDHDLFHVSISAGGKGEKGANADDKSCQFM